MRREWKSLDTHRASDRENKILQEQNANTMHSSKVPVLASGWMERSQKPHPKIARQVALVESDLSAYLRSHSSLTMNSLEDLGKRMTSAGEWVGSTVEVHFVTPGGAKRREPMA